MNKKVAIDQLENAREHLYDADQLLGNLRITKETAECLRQITLNIVEADKKVSSAMENLA